MCTNLLRDSWTSLILLYITAKDGMNFAVLQMEEMLVSVVCGTEVEAFTHL